MTSSPSSARIQSGVLGSVRAGLSAGCVCGLLFGVADGVVAAFGTRAELGVGSFLGCVAAAVFQYSLFFAIGLAIVALVLHAWLVRRDHARRYLLLLAIGCAAGLFAELYWRTREFVFYGRSAVSIERLAAAAGMAAVAIVAGALLARAIARMPGRVQGTLAALVTLAWLGGGLYLASQPELGAGRGSVNERNRDLPNVLLVVVDAMRQDVLGCYGNERIRTPNVDALAKQGVVFENAFVQAPFTLASFGSLLTGKYPRRHGLINQRTTAKMPAQTTLPWHLKHATRADGTQLAPEDVLTASFHTGVLSERTGLLRGFDLLFEETAGHDLADLSSPWSQFRTELLPWIFENRVRKRFDSTLVAREASAWIAKQRGTRFFAMVHLFSTHTPYDPPAKLRDAYCDPKYAGPVKAFYAEHHKAIRTGKYTTTDADVRQIRDLYAGGVAQADEMVGELVAALDSAGLRDDTLVIVTADHGESLGEDGLYEHGHLVRRELRVPLVMAWPKHLPEGRRVEALTEEIDVLPTICDLARIAPPPATDDGSKLDGTSLLPLVRGDVASIREHGFAETERRLSIQTLGAKLDVSRASIVAKDASELEREIDAELREGKGPRYVEYASKTALDEVDRFAERRKEAMELARVLHAWSATMPIRAEEVAPSSADDERNFDDLGYGEGAHDDDARAPRPKPKAPDGSLPSGAPRDNPDGAPR